VASLGVRGRKPQAFLHSHCPAPIHEPSASLTFRIPSYLRIPPWALACYLQRGRKIQDVVGLQAEWRRGG